MVFPYSNTMKVRYSDTDPQGHMYFANYLVFADEILGEFWGELGMSFARLDRAPSLTFAVNANIDFLSECLADDVLEVAAGFSRLGHSSADTAFELKNLRTGEIAARGKFTHVFTDKVTRKSMPIPDAFRAAIVARQPELA